MNSEKISNNLKTAFVHTVFFWLKNPDNAAEKAQLHAGLRSISTIFGMVISEKILKVRHKRCFGISMIFGAPELGFDLRLIQVKVRR